MAGELEYWLVVEPPALNDPQGLLIVSVFHLVLKILRLVDYESKRPIIFLANILNHYWNLIRVSHSPHPELQIFEPMGKPAKRQTRSNHARSGVSHRYITKELINWLNECYPLSCIDTEGWISCSCSAIISQQQTTGFDCGVATLLYAEKCGQVHSFRCYFIKLHSR